MDWIQSMNKLETNSEKIIPGFWIPITIHSELPFLRDDIPSRRSNHHAYLVRWCDVKVGENVNRWRSGRATKDSVEPLHDHLFMKRNLLQSPPHLPCPLCPLCSWTLRPSSKPWKIIKPQRPHRISSIGVGFFSGGGRQEDKCGNMENLNIGWKKNHQKQKKQTIGESQR